MVKPSPDALAELRLGHLNIVQGIVSRMSEHSATVKNFSVTVAAGGAALSIQQQSDAILWVAVGASVIFAALDAYYHAFERAFRDQYRAIASRPLDDATDLTIDRPKAAPLEAVRSFSIWSFYAPVLAVLVVLTYYN